MKEKKTFLLYTDSYEDIKLLSIKERGELLTALFDYAENGTQFRTDNVALMIVFNSMRRFIDRDSEKYEQICERNRENGCRGGRPKKKNDECCVQENERNTESRDEKTGKTGRFSSKPGKADNDNDNDNNYDNDNDNGSDNDNEPQEPCGSPGGAHERAPALNNGTEIFVAPCINDINAYCTETGKPIDAQAFIAYYESIGWRVGNRPMRDWKAAVRRWRLRDEENGNVYGMSRKKDLSNEQITRFAELERQSLELYADLI